MQFQLHMQNIIMIRPASFSLSTLAQHSQRRLLASATATGSTATPAAAAAPLIKIQPHLIAPNARTPAEPTASADAPHLGPSLLVTRGPASDQVQHFLTPAERHFLFTMVPKAATSPSWAQHMDATSKTLVMSPHLAQLSPNGTSDLIYNRTKDATSQKVANSPDPFAPPTPDAADVVAERMDMVRRILSLQSGNQAMVTKWNVQRAMELTARKHGDTGSPEVQAAVLTVRINNLKRHLSEGKGKKDKHNARGLQGLESQRTKVLKYLKKRNLKSYYETLHKLGL
ncbi:hypothetical protein BCR44DRAFT_1514867 [Catenaria anguillulae PL171]|uniref:Ribosomal protein S15 n=1 Tax=Catenaria anguillulae PL171 TaxID=765915 RepID=A0A1Y2HFF3_9FUNG|nr:hypothetical protein BCR44DRAFT_1514867 [Catenaria anguillulae PL171]